MTIFNSKKLNQASYKGVDFNYQDTTIAGGRKTVTHEYPDSKIRNVEDLGGLEKIFTVTAVIDTNVSYADRDNFINILEEEGIGTLIHPEFGTHNVTLISYSTNSSITKFGWAAFDLNFEVSEDTRLPSTSNNKKGLLATLKTKLLGNNEAAFDSAWSSVKSKKREFDAAVETTQKTSEEIQRVSATVEGSVDGISDYVTVLNELVADASSLVQQPSVLSSKLTTAFNNLELAYNSSDDVFNVVRKLFGFNQGNNAFGNSGQQANIRNNDAQINNFVNAAALAVAYNAAVNINYSNFDEISNVNNILEEGFESLPLNLDRTVLDNLIEMRLATTTTLTNTGITLPRVVTLKTKRVSLNVLVYSLYGSNEKKNQIKNLNQFIDTSQVEGEIKALSF